MVLQFRKMFSENSLLVPFGKCMNLFEIACFESFTLSLPGVSLVDQWGSRVAKVSDKVFTLLRLVSPDLNSIVFKCPEESFVVLTGSRVSSRRLTSLSGGGFAFPRRRVLVIAN